MMEDVPLTPPTPENPTAGRPLAMWMRSHKARADRLVRLIDLEAPAWIIQNEIRLNRQALDAISAIVGGADDPRAYAAPQCPHGGPLGKCADCVREHQEATQ